MIYIYIYLYILVEVYGIGYPFSSDPCGTWHLRGSALGSPEAAATSAASLRSAAGARSRGAPSRGHAEASPGGRGGPPGGGRSHPEVAVELPSGELT